MTDYFHVTCTHCGGNGERFGGLAADGGERWYRCLHCNGSGQRRRVFPKPGMPATRHFGSDRYAAEVESVSKSGHRLTLVGGAVYTRRKNGNYVLKGCDSGGLTLGVAEDYLDPSF